MTWSQLPPVGTPVRAPLTAQKSVRALAFEGFDHCFLNSGTAALALAIKKIASYAPSPSLKVVIPGYGCPDLVAACVYAGATPVIIDYEPARYQYNMVQLRSLADDITAVICPSLLGISMDILEVRKAVGKEVFIIEDDAQWFPEHPDQAIQQQNVNAPEHYILPPQSQHSDFIITSFGRGKPVNLLGGGMLAWHKSYADWFKGNSCVSTNATKRSAAFLIKAWLFNQLCRPVCYGAVTRVPGLQLGATRYHPLNHIEALQDEKTLLAGSAITSYLNVEPAPQQQLFTNITCAWGNQAKGKRLLRFPLLATDRETRDDLANRLNNAGLGASLMYALPLYDIDKVKDKVERPFSTPVANLIADTFFTLPVHVGVKRKHIEKMVKIIGADHAKLIQAPAL